MSATRNPYKVPLGFVSDPFAPLYQQPDEELSEDLSVQLILDYANELDDKIAGDFDLGVVINEIKNNTLSFVRTGLLAFKVKVLKLYREGYRTFKDFCEQAIGITHWQVNRTIEAARVVIELAQNGFKILPKNEAQARPLAKFTGADLLANWQTVLDTTKEYKITGSRIAETLGMDVTSKLLRLPPEVYYELQTQALSEGMSVAELLKAILAQRKEVEEPDEQQLQAWQQDLDTLVAEEEPKSVPIGKVSAPKSEPIGTVTPDDILASEPLTEQTPAEPDDTLTEQPLTLVAEEESKSVPIGKVSTEPTLTEEGDPPLWMEETNGVTQKSSSSTTILTERGSKASDSQAQASTKKHRKSFLDFNKGSSGKKKRPRGFGR